MKRILVVVLLLVILTTQAICERQEFLDISSFSLVPSIQGVNVLTGEVNETAIMYISEEKYQEGENQVGKEVLFLAKEDFRIGKVRTIHSCDGISDIHFYYEPGMTRVCEGSENTIYRYAQQNLLYSVEYYQENDSGLLTLLKCEHLYWQKNHSSPRLTTRQLQNADGQTILCNCFFYNEQGELVEEKMMGHLLDGAPFSCQIGEDGYPQMDEVENDEVSYIYSEEDSNDSEEDSNFIVSQIEDKDVETMNESDNVNHFFSSCFEYLQISSSKVGLKMNDLRLSAPSFEALEQLAKNLLGAPTYLLLGFHNEETRVDVYGEHELSDKVRVTFINGILNTTPMLYESLEDICESHGRVKVHHVYRPTEGWTWDISRAVAIRTAFALGFRSVHAHLLAQLWKDLIQEMGGVEGGGVIIHYAHSLGGSDTDRARTLLTPEEQKMIRVISFGSSTLIRNEGFQSVVNMISINDGVSSCILEPLGHLRNFFDPNSNVRFYSALHKPPYWPTDHMFNGPTYLTLLQELGEEFLKEFSQK